ncbi:hypothetical protein ACFQZ8_04335 [Micromonospora azadirachtae]|uniref:Uncharacterized protein n=1 Tax=Micromonospora azadirachtae TaxID=1970735 RepID=A0ABW2ZWZ7_9ACTN
MYDDVLAAMESTLRDPATRTRYLGGTAGTREVTAALLGPTRPGQL